MAMRGRQATARPTPARNESVFTQDDDGQLSIVYAPDINAVFVAGVATCS